MLHFILHHYGQVLVGGAAGVIVGGFFPAYSVAAAKFVAAQYRKVVH